MVFYLGRKGKEQKGRLRIKYVKFYNCPVLWYVTSHRNGLEQVLIPPLMLFPVASVNHLTFVPKSPYSTIGNFKT